MKYGMSLVGKWVELVTVISNALNQTQKDKYVVFLLTCESQNLLGHMKLCVYV